MKKLGDSRDRGSDVDCGTCTFLLRPEREPDYSFVTSTIRVQVLLVKPVCKRQLRRYFFTLGSGDDACQPVDV